MMQLSMFPNFLDSKMIGIDRGKMTTTTMINRVNTMTRRQNDLVVKKDVRVFLLAKNKNTNE